MRAACRRVGEALEGYLAGCTPEAEALAVEAHLQTCPQCRQAAALERLLQQQQGSAEDMLLAAPDLAARVLGARERESWTQRLGRRWRRAAGEALAAGYRWTVDPLLRAGYALRLAQMGLELHLAAPLRACGGALRDELDGARQTVTIPLVRAYELAVLPLTGRTR